ncbi:epidermal growth factor-like protein 7 isoform X1 [Desmodus rotundus]|uniref:epidermal growth factor-like protein 7 isoform X1 n=1 Tax=Desmodus rotundus TaxID=9430 RepID=UPI0023819343|nr:epidermal growth factor-like protein 7 isoform X1 [Desmodus rotundus]
MTEPPSPGHPEEKAAPAGDSGHVGLLGAAPAVAPGAGGGRHGARLQTWAQGVCPWGSPGPRVRVLRTACVPALPHHLRRAPSLQHVPVRGCCHHATIYRTAYRRSPGPTPARPRYACCPGWKRTGRLPGACGAAICQPPCQNGGSCVQPGRCHCPAGWQGDTCQTDGHGAGGGVCPHRCANAVGSDCCRCPEGHGPSTGGKLSPPRRGTPEVAPNPDKGVDSVMEEEVQRLRSRVDVLEQKLQLVLAPLHSLASRALEQGLPDPGSLLAHSLQQLDRIDSLSEQISFLEEQLGSCSCKKEL